MKQGKVLIIDDDIDVLDTARIFLKRNYQLIITENNPEKIITHITNNEFDAIMLDMNYSKGKIDGAEGFYWLNEILKVNPGCIIIMMTAYGDIDLAVKAIKNGATDFILKPWNNHKLLATLNTAIKLNEQNKEIKKLRSAQKKITEDLRHNQGEFIGNSKVMLNVFQIIQKVSKTDADVLILGENGTGKELVARAIHENSLRKNEPFIRVDLGSLSETLFESELFGYVKGAFTDAKEDKEGRFELASGGTIFLDEIGNLSLTLQAKLLSVLQERKVFRLGSNKEIPVDVRLISATNMPVSKMIEENKFREDLLYRINTVEINLPALRDRIGDIPLLTHYFLKEFARKYAKNNLKISNDTILKLQKYLWPGNVRELRHAIERAVILSDGNSISIDEILLNKKSNQIIDKKKTFNLDENERQLIIGAIEKNKGNITKAANDLGIARAALYRRLEKYGI